MRTSDGGYVFSFSDFNPSPRLSTTEDEPAIAGHIRWLKRRAEQLLSRETGFEFNELCHDWRNELFQDECKLHREGKWSPHAQFDLEETEDGDFPDFPSDTESVILGYWLNQVLDSGDPNPIRLQRTRRKDRSRPRTSARLHEMLAAIALSDLHRAITLLVTDAHTNGTTVMELLLSASECVNRSEMHLWAESRAAKGGESKTYQPPRRIAVGTRIEPPQPLETNQARVTRHPGSLDFEYSGERHQLVRVTKNGCLTRGFSILLDLLLMPGREVQLLTLDKSYRHQTPVPLGDKPVPPLSITEAEKQGLYAVSDQESLTPSEKRVEVLLKRAKEAQAGGDEEEAGRLKAQALEIFESDNTLMQKLGTRPVARTRTRLQSPETRAAIRNSGKRLDDAIQRLAKEFPALGGHLKASIKTTKSESVRYDPHPHIVWVIEENE
jgi:hypothetical protein